MMWKIGAFITFASLLSGLAGAGLVIGGLSGFDYESKMGGNFAMTIQGMIMSALGCGGAFVGGPLVRIAGIGREPG